MIKQLILFVAACLILQAGSPVQADQHSLVSPGVAEKTRALIQPGTELRLFCQLCGDKTWAAIEATHIALHSDSEFSEVRINGKGIDLAYTYIFSDGKWVNLARKVGLETSGVSEYLDGGSADRTPESSSNQPGTEHLTEHPIDQWLTECMDKDPTTAGMSNCLFEAYEKWDAELNKVYMELRKKLSPAQQKALKAAQVKWLKFRDAEFEMIEQFYNGFDGTMYQPMRLGDRVEVVRKRVMGLRSYLNLLEER